MNKLFRTALDANLGIATEVFYALAIIVVSFFICLIVSFRI